MQPSRLRLNVGKACGPDIMETNGQEEDPWGPAVMNGTKQSVYFSRFMGLGSFLDQGCICLQYVCEKGQVQDFVCAAKSSRGTC